MKISPLKTCCLLHICVLFSFSMVEILIRATINHPTYNIEKKLSGLRKSNNGITEIYMPYSRFWTSEGGYNISVTNNLGLSGSDVILSDTSKYIYILGSSYVQANQVERYKISTSVLQSKLGYNSRYQIINLGEGGLDQYDSYFKMKYYEKLYKPELIFMILERVDDRWLSRHDTLNFDIDGNAVFEIEPGIIEKVEHYLRTYSAFINLLSNGYKITSKIGFNGSNRINTINDPNETKAENISKKLLTCINKFSEVYKSKFMLVSIINNDEINNSLDKYCKEKNIHFSCSKINRNENKLNQNGHLNENGNRELGNFLYKLIEENNLNKHD